MGFVDGELNCWIGGWLVIIGWFGVRTSVELFRGVWFIYLLSLNGMLLYLGEWVDESQ